MKKAGTVLLILLSFIGSLAHINHNNTPIHDILKNTNGNTILATGSQDTIPPIPWKGFKSPTPPKPPVQTSFIQKLLSAFRFKKTADANEKVRVLKIIDSLQIPQNFRATEENIKLIDSALKKSNLNFDTLRKNIKDIDSIQRIRDSLIKSNAAGIENIKNDIRNAFPPRGKKDPNFNIDQEMAKLALKMKDIIHLKINEDAIRARMTRIAFIDSIRNTSGNIHYSPVDTIKSGSSRMDTLRSKRYYVKVRNRADVYGIYDVNAAGDTNSAHIRQMNYLLVNKYVIDGKSGNIVAMKPEKEGAYDEQISKAQELGCPIGFTFSVFPNDSFTISNFLKNDEAQRLFVRNVMVTLHFVNAFALNIAFDRVPHDEEGKFINFIRYLHNNIKSQEPRMQLLFTIPASSHESEFPLQQLNFYADRFIIDFSRDFERSPGPLAPLFGAQPNSIQATLSRYKGLDIPYSKIIINLPLRGSAWAFTPTFGGTFYGYLSYENIRNELWSRSYFNYYSDDSTIAIIDSTVSVKIGPKDSFPAKRIYYDDEVSLGKKFQFILDSKLGGVALNALGEDKGFSNIWDEVIFRFADTTNSYLPDSLGVSYNKLHDLNWFQKSSRYLRLFHFILNNPCESCFLDNKDPDLNRELLNCLIDLDIDSLMKTENTERLAAGKEPYRNWFEYVNAKLNNILKVITIIIGLLLILFIVLYFYMTIKIGDDWTWKKKTGWACVVFSFLFIITLFSFLFCSDSVPYFGTSKSNIINYSVYQPDKGLVNTEGDVYAKADCVSNNDTDCINMPLPTLLIIVIASLGIGFLITRYFVIRVVKRKDIP